MSILDNIKQMFGIRAQQVVAPYAPQQQSRPLGLSFNQFDEAGDVMQLSAYYRCLNIISDTIAQMPCSVYVGEGMDRRKYSESVTSQIMSGMVNASTNIYTLLRNCIADLIHEGNGYIYLHRDLDGAVDALYNIQATRVQVVKDVKLNVIKKYIVSGLGNVATHNMIHIKQYSADGCVGRPVRLVCADIFKIANASDQCALNHFASGLQVGGIITTPTIMTPRQKDDMRSAWAQAFGTTGGRKKSGVAIMEGSQTYTPLQINNRDSQLLESRQWAISEICRIMGVPQGLLGLQNSISYNSQESNGLFFLTQTIAPILAQLEQEMTNKMFLPSERARGAEVKIDSSVILRLNKAEQMSVLSQMFQTGSITSAEIREIMMEGARYIEGSDKTYVQLNMTSQQATENIKDDNE